VGQEVQIALKDVIHTIRNDHQQAMIAGAANTNTVVDAAVVNMTAAQIPIPTLAPAKDMTKEVASPEPTLIVSTLDSTSLTKKTPETRTHTTPEVAYAGRGISSDTAPELVNMRG
jgi:hypothetical protein